MRLLDEQQVRRFAWNDVRFGEVNHRNACSSSFDIVWGG